MVGYGPFSLFVIHKEGHKEGPCPSSGDIIRLMIMMIKFAKSEVKIWAK
jgi:hypothetical protein